MVYLNGIGVVVIEFKHSSIDVANGVRQLISRHDAIFNQAFFNTVQPVMAGNDSQGLRYCTTDTLEKWEKRLGVSLKHSFLSEWKRAGAAVMPLQSTSALIPSW